MFLLTIWLGLNIIVMIWEIQPVNLQCSQHGRFKRIVNITDIKEITKFEHEQKYPYIVGIKTYHKRYDRKKITRCTATMLNGNLLLTTSYCVRNPIQITVFKTSNPAEHSLNNGEINVEIKNMSEANNDIKSGKRNQFPNPLFYGMTISRLHLWYSQYPLEERYTNSPRKNLAIVHLKVPLYPPPLPNEENNITYPLIEGNPGYFTGKNMTANMFGWCQNDTKNDNPRLTKVTVEVSPCESDPAYTANVCIDYEKYQYAFCDADQGGPLFTKQADDDKSPPSKEGMKKHANGQPSRSNGLQKANASPSKQQKPPRTSPVLIAMINTPHAYGHLTYLWAYSDWIDSMLLEYAATPSTPTPCKMTTPKTTWEPISTSEKAKTERVESYYDYEARDLIGVRKARVPCNSAADGSATTSLAFAAAVFQLGRRRV